MVKPFSLKQCGYAINYAVHYTRTYTVHNNRSRDCEHLGGHIQDHALCYCHIEHSNFQKIFTSNRRCVMMK